ncbi:MAG: hypothetical protein ACP5OA_07380 [Candidatus Woesearchaeota archaeon]
MVRADVIVPGSKTIPVCSRITNYDAFPDYVFLAVGMGPMPIAPYWITNDSCIKSGYKFSSVRIYAVEKLYQDEVLNFSYQYSLLTQEDFDKMTDWEKKQIMQLKNLTDSTQSLNAEYSLYALQEQQTHAAQLAIKNEYHISKVDAQIRTSIGSTVSDPRQSIEEIHKITMQDGSFTTKNYTFTQENVSVTAVNNSFKTEVLTSTKSSTPMMLIFFIVPIISLGVIIYLFFRWRKNV